MHRALLALAGLLAAAMTNPAGAQPAEIRVGTSGTANTVLALWMAQAGGL